MQQSPWNCIYSSNINFNIHKAFLLLLKNIKVKSLLWNKPLLQPFFFFFLNCTDLFHFHEYLDLVSEAT